jgi:predicted  nucleic acid-binding Zn-ribbon protein
MSQQHEPQGATTRSRSRAGVRPATAIHPENLETMPGAMPSTIVPEVRANTVLEHPRPLGTIPDTSIDTIEGMTQTMEDQADTLFPEAQTVSQQSSVNPFRVVSSALRSGLMSVQRDDNQEMNKILYSIELCEQHVCNQADYIKRIDAASKRAGDASIIQARQLNSMTTSIGDHGRALQSLLDSIKDLLKEARSTKTTMEEQSKQLANLQAQVTAFQEQVFAAQEREEAQAEEGEPSPVVEAAQQETPFFLRGEVNHGLLIGEPECRNHHLNHHPRKTKTGQVPVASQQGSLLPVLLDPDQGNRTPQQEKEGSLLLLPLSTFLRKFA